MLIGPTNFGTCPREFVGGCCEMCMLFQEKSPYFPSSDYLHLRVKRVRLARKSRKMYLVFSVTVNEMRVNPSMHLSESIDVEV